MKSLKLFLLFFLANAFEINAQQNSLSSINFSVVTPSTLQNLDENQTSLLKMKIINIVTANGVSADDYNQNFIIYPNFNVSNEQQSQGGMRRLFILNCQISLTIKQNGTNIIFSSFSKNYQTSGYTKYEAVSNAINLIEESDENLISFIKLAKQKIINYYNSNCENTLRKADSKRNIKEYEQALAILLTVPEEATSCYSNAQERAKIVFAQLQKNECDKYLQKAKLELANKNYDQALSYLSWIDPNSSCKTELQKVIKNISTQIDDNKKKEWEYMLSVDAAKNSIKKMEIQAMNNLTIAWLKARYNN